MSKTKKKAKNHFPKGFLMAGHKKKPLKSKARKATLEMDQIVEKLEAADFKTSNVVVPHGSDAHQILRAVFSHDDDVLNGLFGDEHDDTKPSAEDWNGVRRLLNLKPEKKGKQTCGSCLAGIVPNHEKGTIETCDECKLFETDEDALAAVVPLLELLDAEYKAGPGCLTAQLMESRHRHSVDEHGNTVADALDRLKAKVEYHS